MWDLEKSKGDKRFSLGGEVARGKPQNWETIERAWESGVHGPGKTVG